MTTLSRYGESGWRLPARGIGRWVGLLQAIGTRVGLPLLGLSRLKAEDQAAYTHEYYKEHDNRVEVQSDSILAEKLVAPWLDLRIEGVYDAISGATPIGAP